MSPSLDILRQRLSTLAPRKPSVHYEINGRGYDFT